MSTFSTRGGLYERAQKKYKLADGGLFCRGGQQGQPNCKACKPWTRSCGARQAPPRHGSTHVQHPCARIRAVAPAGKMLFTYAFFDRQRPEAQAFFADIYRWAQLRVAGRQCKEETRGKKEASAGGSMRSPWLAAFPERARPALF